MNKSKLDKLREQEELLEQERMNYLEADDNRGAKRIEKKLYRVRELIEVENENGYIEMKRKLKIYKEYIHITGLEKPFNDFYKKEIKKMEE